MDAISKHIVGALREEGKEKIGDVRKGSFVMEDRLLKPDDRIYDLIDIVAENAESDPRKDREIIVIDGRVYERMSDQDGKVYDPADIVEKGSGEPLYGSGIDEEITKRVVEITEKIAREMVPEIAERVIREEIEKLKK